MGRSTGTISTLALSVACTLRAPAPDADGAALRVIDEGTPEAAGVLALVNDVGTTFEVLDLDVPLDRRAAANIVAHRDGADGAPGTGDDDPFDSVAELDAVPYVGDAALEALLMYAVATGWVQADLAGTWDGVTLTHDEAALVVAVANDEGELELDAKARLDRRAVDAILAARPIADMDHLASLYYVGGTAIEALLHWGTVRDAACPYAPDFWDLYYGDWRGQPQVGTYEFCTDPLADGGCPDAVQAHDDFAYAVGPHHSPFCGYGTTIACGPDPAYVDDCCYTAVLTEWCE